MTSAAHAKHVEVDGILLRLSWALRSALPACVDAARSPICETHRLDAAAEVNRDPAEDLFPAKPAFVASLKPEPSTTGE